MPASFVQEAAPACWDISHVPPKLPQPFIGTSLVRYSRASMFVSVVSDTPRGTLWKISQGRTFTESGGDAETTEDSIPGPVLFKTVADGGRDATCFITDCQKGSFGGDAMREFCTSSLYWRSMEMEIDVGSSDVASAHYSVRTIFQ